MLQLNGPSVRVLANLSPELVELLDSRRVSFGVSRSWVVSMLVEYAVAMLRGHAGELGSLQSVLADIVVRDPDEHNDTPVLRLPWRESDESRSVAPCLDCGSDCYVNPDGITVCGSCSLVQF